MATFSSLRADLNAAYGEIVLGSDAEADSAYMAARASFPASGAADHLPIGEQTALTVLAFAVIDAYGERIAARPNVIEPLVRFS